MYDEISSPCFSRMMTLSANQAFLYRLLYFFHLDLTKTLYFQECPARSAVDRLDYRQLNELQRTMELYPYSNGVEAIGFQFGDISGPNAMGLDAVDVHDEALLAQKSNSVTRARWKEKADIPHHYTRPLSLSLPC